MGTHPIFESDFDCLTEMAASAVYILDLKGKVLISRNYRGDMPLNIIEKFPKMLMEAEEEGTVTPVMTDENVTFIHIKCNNIYVVCTTSGNANVMCLVSFMHKLCEVFAEYFKEVEEESIRDNFVTVYELMDEVMDYGSPQFTDSKILQEYITQESHKLEVTEVRPPSTVTNAVSWRSEGVKFHQCVRLSRFDNDRTISFIPPDGEFELMSYR